jgi:site-specific recombinase XerD
MTSLLAVVEDGAQSPSDLFAAYDRYVRSLDCTPTAMTQRRSGARGFLAKWPDPARFMAQPTALRVRDIDRTRSWPFLTWCFLTESCTPDLDLLGAYAKGAHLLAWADWHREDVERTRNVAHELGWAPSWTHQVCVQQLGLVCMTTNRRLDELTADVLVRFAGELATAPSITENQRKVLGHRLAGLRQVCFQLGLLDSPPVRSNAKDHTLADQVAAIPQEAMRAVAVRYLEALVPTLRPKTIGDRADSLELFGLWLAGRRPDLKRWNQLDRSVMEEFLAWNKGRPSRGRRPGRPVGIVRQHQAVTTLRSFFEDLAEWGWAERPRRVLLHKSDLPRLPVAVPRALTPDVDRDLMAAIAHEKDPAARCAVQILRGTGVRLGELIDLELDCLMDFSSHGTWLKVPVGKLNTERMVPLDADTLAAFDDWATRRGRQRALPHSRTGIETDFFFVVGGRRIGGGRIRRALDDAVTRAGLHDASGRSLHITPHQLRHTYGTSLINGGMSLQVLMALLGHVTPEMTLRYANLASDTVKNAYDAAMERARSRHLPVLVAGPTGGFVPDRVAWLEAEMLKTRVAHGYCARHPVAGPCPYANICEQCDNYLPAPEFADALGAQLADVIALRKDAETRGWTGEVARHGRVASDLERHLRRVEIGQPGDGRG